MFEAFGHRIDAELGPLNPDWFEELTAKTVLRHGGYSVVVGQEEPDSLSSYQGDIVQTPGEVLDCQMFSTPMLFGQRDLRSLDVTHNEDCQSPNQGSIKASQKWPWTDSSPNLSDPIKRSHPFSKHSGLQQPNELLGPLDTPKSSRDSAKRVSESLGAQINPDLSWTSSFNTPLALTPTVILTKDEDFGPSASLCHGKGVIFVRKLFPSSRKDNGSTDPHVENTLTSLVQPDAGDTSCQTGGPGGDMDDSPNSSLDNTSSSWRQMVPDAIEDREVRTTVENVLEGAEDVLSIFFSNSSSALRRVKTRGRIKKRQEGISKELKSTPPSDCRSKENESTRRDASTQASVTAGESTSPSESKDGIVWTPLSLSDVSDIAVHPSGLSSLPEQTVHPDGTNQTRTGSASKTAFYPSSSQLFVSSAAEKEDQRQDLQLVTAQLSGGLTDASSTSVLVRKPRRFVYRVSPHPSKQEYKHSVVSSAATISGTTEDALSQERLSNESKPCLYDKFLEAGTSKHLVPMHHKKDNCHDMSQLSKAMAEEISQLVDFSNSSDKYTEDEAKIRLENWEIPLEVRGGERRCNAEIMLQDSVLENNSIAADGSMNSITMHRGDSGCPTTFADMSKVTVSDDLHQLRSTSPDALSMASKQSLDECLRQGMMDAQMTQSITNIVKVVPQKNTKELPNGRISEMEARTHRGFPLADGSGFKTAANQKVNVSSANLQKAVEFFKDIEGEKSALTSFCRDQVGSNSTEKKELSSTSKTHLVNGACIKSGSCSNQKNVDNAPLLTASQKADVSELCSLLEDADSQYEFTQFKPGKQGADCHNHPPHQPCEKDWDPDICTGIDFDDSFNCDIKQVSKTCPMEMNAVDGHASVSECKRHGDTLNQSIGGSASHTPQARKMTLDVLHSDSDGRSTLVVPGVDLNSKSGHNPDDNLTKRFPNIGFKTAKGSNLKISGEGMSRAVKLFADLAEDEACLMKAREKTRSTVRKQRFENNTNRIQSLPLQCNGESDWSTKQESTHTSRVADHCNMHYNNGGNSNELAPNCKANLRHGEKDPVLNLCSVTDIGTKPEGTERRSDHVPKDPGIFGFCTAGGKRVEVSEKAFLHAKSLLNDIVSPEGIEMPKQAKSSLNTARATVSTNAPLKPKALHWAGEATPQAKTPARQCCKVDTVDSGTGFSHVRNDATLSTSEGVPGEDKSENSLQNVLEEGAILSIQPKHGRGFQTASGKGVTVSARSLQKAKDIFKDCDAIMVSLEETEIKEEKANKLEFSKQKLGHGFSTASGKGVKISAKALQEAKAVFKDCDIDDPVVARTEERSVCPKSVYSAPAKGERGFNTVHGKTLHAYENNRLAGQVPQNRGGQEGAADIDECLSMGLAETLVEEPQFGGNCGFNTASGKKVSVSAEALHKAKTLLSDEGDFSPCRKGDEWSKDSEIPKTESNGPGKNWGFSTASGRKVSVSEKALQKAKSLLEECDVGHAENDPEGKDTRLPPSVENPQPTRFWGFSTAGGKGVNISAKALQEVKAVFAGIDDLNGNGENQATSLKGHLDAENAEVHGAEGKERGHGPDCLIASSFSTAVRKGVAESKKVLKEACDVLKVCDKPPIKNVPKQKEQTPISEASPPVNNHKSLPLNYRMKQEDHQIKLEKSVGLGLALKSSHDAPSPKNFSPFGKGTDTQQRYLEQEALACTKALLEDEDLNSQRSQMTLKDVANREISSQNLNRDPFDERNPGTGKRLLDADDLNDKSSQPPLKRQLLAEFDQTADGTKRSAAIPVKSSPNGILKDRRVFKYKVPLQPNVTCPYRTATDLKSNNPEAQIGTRDSLVKNGPANSRVAAFAPPFRKNADPGIPNKAALREPTGPAAAFIPPVRKNDSLKNTIQVDCAHQILNTLATEKTIQPIHEAQSVVSHAGDQKNQNVQCDPGNETEDVSVERQPNSDKDAEEALQLARDMQDMRIRKKRRQNIRPLPGSLYLAKTSGVKRTSLREAAGYKHPARHSQDELYQHGVLSYVSQVTSGTAESSRFELDFFIRRGLFVEAGGVQLADGGWLVPDNKGTVGKEEFYRALCDTPGVDPKLISEAWVGNHFGWIVWKLASMERALPALMGSLCLNPERILLQLKYRYDVEVDHSQRSALKKIMERDDSPAKTLVLCVCAEVKPGHSSPKRNQELEAGKTPIGTDARVGRPVGTVRLTDGWYSIKALLDRPLTAMLQRGLLAPGGKIMVYGAELVGSQDACSPLDAPESLVLKISANSTRRARWDAKLGFHRDPRPFRLSLSSLYADGGQVGCVNVIVLRSYPIQWMEKKPGGMFVFRNDRAEEREARRHKDATQGAMEALFTKIQAQFEAEENGKTRTRGRRSTLSRHEIEALQDGEELHDALERDPGHLEALLSERQLETLGSFRRGLGERRRAVLQERFHTALQGAPQDAQQSCPSREVTPVWKLSVTDATEVQQSSNVYTLNIWRPSVELRALLREGCRYRVYHLAVSEGKKGTGNATVQLTATKKTQFQELEVSPEWLRERFHARRCASFQALQNPEFSSPCGEVDVVGYVISIVDRQGMSPVLYLVDERHDLISVRSCGSLAQLAVEDLVKPQASVALSNLQLRQPSSPVPSLYAGERTLFSANPKEPHLQQAMARLRTAVQSNEHFFRVAEEKFSNLVRADGLTTFQSPRTPGIIANPRPNGSINATPQKPMAYLTPLSKRTLVTTAGTSEGKDPRSVKRKRGLDYLTRVPSPPPISPLGTMTSPCVRNTFNPPRRCVTPQTPCSGPTPARPPAPPTEEEEWVRDEELAMINTQALLDGLREADKKQR